MNKSDRVLAELLEAARHGNSSALGQLLEAHRRLLTAIASAQLHGRIAGRLDASDLVQQTFLEAQRDFAQFRGQHAAELINWLKRILERNMANTIRDHLQIEKRSVGRERSMDDQSESMVALRDKLRSALTSPSQKAIRGEDAKRLLRALSALPDDQQTAVRLRHLEGWSLEEIARHFDRSPSAVAALIKRGMGRLRQELES